MFKIKACIPGFSVEAGNRQIPPPVKTKVAACAGNEICLCVPNFFNKVINEYSSILEFSAYLEESTNALPSFSTGVPLTVVSLVFE